MRTVQLGCTNYWTSEGTDDRLWPLTLVRCNAAIFPESEVDRTRSRASAIQTSYFRLVRTTWVALAIETRSVM
jgi:hypothetical protein